MPTTLDSCALSRLLVMRVPQAKWGMDDRFRIGKGAKKPGVARFVLVPALLRKNGVTKAAADLCQFGKRKLLNFNGTFNDCRVHGNPLLQEEKHTQNPQLPK